MNYKSNTEAAPVHSAENAQRMLGVSRTTFYKLLKSGELRARKIGRRTVVPDDDLRAFLDGLPAYQSEASGARAA